MVLMVDENPSDQPEFETSKLHVENMAWVSEDGKEDIFWGCPNCLTDCYFMDVTEHGQIDETINN
jgi:hypothetical protein